MAATLEIPIALKNFQRVMNQLQQIQGQVAAIGSVQIGAGGGGGGGNNVQGGSGSAGGQTKAPRAPRTPPNFSSRLNTFVRSTRFGGGVSPLVGRGLDLFAPQLGALAGPVGLFAVGLVKAVQGLKDFVVQTNASSQQFRSLQFATNTTPAQAGQLQALGAAIGSDGNGIAGLNSNLVGAAAGGGPGAYAATQLGLQAGPSYLVNRDAATNLTKVYNRLQTLSPDRAQQLLGMTGATDLMKFKGLPRSQFNSLLSSGSALGGAQGDTAKNQQDLTSALSTLNGSVQTLITTLGGKLAGPAANAINGIMNTGSGGKIGNVINDLLTRRPVQAFKDLFGSDTKSEGAKSTGEKLVEATKKNTAATQANTASLAVPGTYGQSTRGDAIGNGMGGLALQRMLANRKALQLSPF